MEKKDFFLIKHYSFSAIVIPYLLSNYNNIGQDKMIALTTNDNNFIVNNARKKHFEHNAG